MLTYDMLSMMPEYTIFATGQASDSPEGINMTNSGKMLRWVAISGSNKDWCIYCHWHHYLINWIACNGDKVRDPGTIRKLVPCSDDAYARYRR